MTKNGYENLLVWQNNLVLDVRYWCEPEITKKAILEIPNLFPEMRYDGFVGLEAKGFFLSGIASTLFNFPTIMVRKYKNSYANRKHFKQDFTNWRGHPDSIAVVERSMPKVKKVLVVDDIIDTGASLEATRVLLEKFDVEIVGAFYFCDCRKETARFDFPFPVRSLIKSMLVS